MQRDLLRSRIAKLPHLPPLDPDRHLEVTEDEEEEALDSFPEDPTAPAVAKPRRRLPVGRDYSPLSAAGYFADALEVDVPVQSVYQLSDPSSDDRYSPCASSGTAKFRVYYTPPPAPPSSSFKQSTLSIAAAEDDDEEAGSPHGVVFVCVHGAGYSGLSWACLAKELAAKAAEGKTCAGVLAYDARGHGKTALPSPGDGESGTVDMSLSSMSSDLCAVLKAMYPLRETAPTLVLVGHSMGGAVVADACNRIQAEVADVTGVVVVDVVEGTAIDALPGMSTLIASQPKKFDSPAAAIAWHVSSKTINNLTSARISVPPLVKPLQEGADECSWRVDLAKTEPYWRGWFTGLSAKFLSCRAAKLLLLAGTDRLDRELLIGQMQGKYQLEVDPLVGHCVHEDAPERTAEALLSFFERNDRTNQAAILASVPRPPGSA
ncbi:hypothetical protein JCM11251_003253 [Rhodosporidiobolus azoricus]